MDTTARRKRRRKAAVATSGSGAAINVACVGDSITQGYLASRGMDYPTQMQKLLGSGYKVMNFGAGGRTMLKKGDNPYWRTGPLKQALASQPAIVVLMLGTNDAKYRNWGPLHAEFPIDYMAMVNDFKNLSTTPKIYLMVPPPLYQDGRYGMNQTVINTLFPGTGPAGVRTLAKAAGLEEPIDLYSLWQAHCPVLGGTPGHAPNKTDVPCDWIASGGKDACHPSDVGYGKLAAAVKAVIAKTDDESGGGAKDGCCGDTDPHPGADACDKYPSGEWDTEKLHITSLEQCAERCKKCKQCAFVSYNPHPDHKDCSWYRSCDLSHLEPVQGYKSERVRTLPPPPAPTPANVSVTVPLSASATKNVTTIATIEVDVMPFLGRKINGKTDGGPHDKAFYWLSKLDADMVRFAPWFPNPKLVRTNA